MKARKLKTLLLGTSALMGVVLTSCNRANAFTTVKASEQKEVKKQEQQRDIEQDLLMRQKYQKNCADSVRFVNGYDSLRSQISNLRANAASLRARADSLAAEHSLGATMQREVEDSGNEILTDFVHDLSNLLSAYQVSLEDYIAEETDFYWRFKTNTQQEYDQTDYVLKQPLIYVGVNTGGLSDISGHEFDELVAVITQVINESNYGQTRKNEIINKVNALIKKVKPKLIASRKAIERQYADYYVVMDGHDAAFMDYGEGDWDYGYTDLEYPERQAVVRVKTLSVYDQNLPVDFFGDKTASYMLVSLSNDRWQVQKITANGRFEMTPVFTDKGVTRVQEYYASMDATDSHEFSYDPGYNVGVHVVKEDRVVIKRAKKQWYPSRTVINQVDSLDRQAKLMEGQADKLDEQKRRINQHADSVANMMVGKRFNGR